MSRRLFAVAVPIAGAALAYFLLRRPEPTSSRTGPESAFATPNDDRGAPGSPPWDETTAPDERAAPTADDIEVMQRLMQGEPDAGVPPATGIGLAAALAAGIPRDRALEALDIAAQRVIADALAGCASRVHITAPVSVAVHGEGGFIETIESTGSGEFANCTRALFGAYLPHEESRREFTVAVP